MNVFPNSAKRRLTNGELAIGFVLRQSRTADIACIGRACGFDWLSIDLEHSSIDVDTAAQIAAAALPAGIAALARVPSMRYGEAACLLDAGAQGLIVPHIDTAEEAQFIVSYAKFPPFGNRSIASVQPLLGYRATSNDDAMLQINSETLIVAMLETQKAIENADSIAAVAGIDVLLIGSNDLCSEMGITGQFGHPRMMDTYEQVNEACRRHGKYAGMAGIHDRELIARLVGFGTRFITGGTDLSFLMKAATERADLVRGLTTS